MKRTASTVVAILVAFSVVLQCAAPATALAEKKRTLHLLSSGGSFGRAVHTAYAVPFQKKTGIRVISVPGGEDPIATLKAQSIAGRVSIDIAIMSVTQLNMIDDIISEHGLRLPDDLLIRQPLEHKLVPFDLEAAAVLVCNEELVKRCPTSRTSYFDTKNFPGPRGMVNVSIGDIMPALELALLADGVKQRDIYPMDLDRAFARLRSVRKDIRVFWDNGTQSQDIVRSGEVFYNLMGNGRAEQLVAHHGMKLKLIYDGVTVAASGMAIPKNAPHPVEAREFLKFVLENPQQQAVFTSLTLYGPVTKRGADAVAAKGVGGHTGLHMGRAFVADLAYQKKKDAWVAANGNDVLERWNAFIGR